MNWRKRIKRKPRMSRDDDQHLIEQCLGQSRQAQFHLFQRYYRRMLGVCSRYARSQHEAEDMAQEGFVKFFEKLPHYDAQRKLENWMTTLFIHNAIDYLRRHRREQHFAEPEAANHLAVAPAALDQLQTEDLMQLLQQLPDGYRLVFNMYAIEGFSHREIAEALDISEGTSKSQLAKARKWLQQRLSRQNVPEN